MDPVSKLSRALALLRRTPTDPRATPGRLLSASSAGPAAGSDLRETIARRLREIPPDAPERRTRAVRVFVEQVLFAEFGEELKHSFRFQEMVGEVQRVMEGDPGLRAELDQLIAELAMRR
jgi:hypothetical protein